MRWIRTSLVCLILLGAVDSCLKQPDYSIVPDITSAAVTFKHEFPAAADTLIVTLGFRDGDGDLGLDPDETAIYTSDTDSTDINSPFYYIYDSTQNTVWYYSHEPDLNLPQGYKYVDYASYRKIQAAPFDTLPSLTCRNWQYNSSPADTLYFQNNPYFDNIFVYLMLKNSDGSYTYFDPNDPKNFPFTMDCPGDFFNGRFPILSTDLGKKSPLDGVMTYRITSAALYFLFHGKTAKLDIYIMDRAFHKSALFSTEDFVFN